MRHLEIEEWMSWRFFGHQGGVRISNRNLKKEHGLVILRDLEQPEGWTYIRQR